MFHKDRILSASQLKSLAEHKYNSVCCSLLDPLLQPWWNYLVSHTPLWLAPNLITVTGLVINIATSLVLVCYCPDARTEPPNWSCLLCALGLFVFQSLDAIDGKQARITNTSSPLGELFDHGCDAISAVFIVLSASLVVRLGFYPHLMILLFFTGMLTFYCAHWKTYVTGTLRFGMIDATEVQAIFMGIHVISGMFGADVWWFEVPYTNLPFVLIFSTATLILVIIYLVKSFLEICSGGVGKNGSSIAGTSVLSPAIPFGFAVIPGYIIYCKSLEGVYENHPALYILAFGMVCAKVTNRLVIAHMTKTEIEYLDSALVGPAMLFFNQYFDFYLPEYPVLWGCLVWIIFDLVIYSTQVCREICDHLNIRLFHIPTVRRVVSTPRRGLFGVLWSPSTKIVHPKEVINEDDPRETSNKLLLDTTKDVMTLDQL